VRKYQEDGGPSLRRVADILGAVGPRDSLESLLRATTCNVLIGNGDAHAKNFSLLHKPSGSLELSPLYDLLCTLHYGDDRLAMYVDTVHRSTRVTAERLISEAASWGLARRIAAEVVADVLERASTAISAAADETPDLPIEIPTIVKSQLDRLQGRE
jgi:serine/threonine-protein kinase HipA